MTAQGGMAERAVAAGFPGVMRRGGGAVVSDPAGVPARGRASRAARGRGLGAAVLRLVAGLLLMALAVVPAAAQDTKAQDTKAPETAAQDASALAATAPEHIVRLLYQHYIDTPAGLVISFDFKDPVVASNYFDPTLARLLVADGVQDSPELDFDPFVNGQDFEVKAVDLETHMLADDKAEVTAHFKNFDADETRIFTVVRTKRGWRIADVRGEDEEKSLRDFLTGAH